MGPFAHASQELSRAESLALLVTESYGRLVLVRGGMPVVVPVNFVLTGGGVVLRTSATSPAAAAPSAPAVAFQADCIDRDTCSGWTVTVVGRARLPYDELECGRLRQLPLHPWVAGERDHYLVVAVGNVSGRRIGGPEPRHVPSGVGGLVASGPSALPDRLARA